MERSRAALRSQALESKGHDHGQEHHLPLVRSVNWQITPRVLTEAMAAGGDEAKRAFDAMMEMGKIDVAKIEAARRG